MKHESDSTFMNTIFGIATAKSTPDVRISRKHYDKFCKEYIFDALKDKPFGVSFCKHFEIIDYLLLMNNNVEQAKKYIETSGYIKK